MEDLWSNLSFDVPDDIAERFASDFGFDDSEDDFYEDFNPFVSGLTTGRTPTGLYRELVKRYQAGEVSFANVAVYSLDEFYPILPTVKQSRNYRIHEELLNHIDIRPENINFPDGTLAREELPAFCANYGKEKIDLMIIGVGEQVDDLVPFDANAFVEALI